MKNLRLNLVPFGRRGLDAKEKLGIDWNLPNWKRYQHRYYEGEIEETDNVCLITGNMPDSEYSTVVVDFDGELYRPDLLSIARTLRYFKIEPMEVTWTNNRGLHFICFSDRGGVRNSQGKRLKHGVFPTAVKHMDIRGSGGLLYYPPTHFSDGIQAYKTIWRSTSLNIIPSEQFQELKDSVYLKPTKAQQESLKKQVKELQADLNLVISDRLQCLRYPFRLLMSKNAPDIEVISASTGVMEFLYWNALWREVICSGFSEELAHRLLKRYQPKYDREETLTQINYHCRGEDKRPFTNNKLHEMFPFWEAPVYRSGGYVEN